MPAAWLLSGRDARDKLAAGRGRLGGPLPLALPLPLPLPLPAPSPEVHKLDLGCLQNMQSPQ